MDILCDRLWSDAKPSIIGQPYSFFILREDLMPLGPITVFLVVSTAEPRYTVQSEAHPWISHGTSPL